LNRFLEKRLGSVDSILHIEKKLWQSASGPYAELMRTAVEAFCRAESQSTTTAARIGHVENALQRGVAEVTIQYESKMVLLGSIVTGAPFLGLLGTVWGVMDAFGAVALKSTASIQMLAPGVSGALLTTVAGLLVAIPSVFGYNFLLTQTKIAITEIENYASSLADQIEIEAFELKPG
jgi:biopolymer transport protein TolQ